MYKGAIIGFGKIARTNHLLAYHSSEIRDKLKITSIVEPEINNHGNNKNEFPDLKFYRTIEELFENEKIDFIDIAAPPAYHFDILKECISKNVHIICEKPFTILPSHALQIKNMLENSDLVFIPCHQYKYSPIWKIFKNFVEKNSENSKVLLQFNVFRKEADPGLAQGGKIWRTDTREAGGGILADTGVHYLYLSSWMLGNISRISAHLVNLGITKIKSEDTALIVLDGEKGSAQISLTWAADKRYNSTQAICKDESIIYSGGKNLIININGRSSEIEVPDMSDKKNYTSLYISLFLDFYEAVKKNKIDNSWINEAYNSICLMDKCYRSSETNRAI